MVTEIDEQAEGQVLMTNSSWIWRDEAQQVQGRMLMKVDGARDGGRTVD